MFGSGHTFEMDLAMAASLSVNMTFGFEKVFSKHLNRQLKVDSFSEAMIPAASTQEIPSFFIEVNKESFNP